MTSGVWQGGTKEHPHRHAGRNQMLRVQARKRYAANRLKGIEYLGGACVVCGVTDPDELEFDHIDPSTKVVDMKKLWKNSWEKIMTELPKCQLLCKLCHADKTYGEERSRSCPV